MRVALGLVLGAVALLVGCADDSSSGPARAGTHGPEKVGATTTAPAAPTDGTTTPAATPASPAMTACAAVKAPTALSDAKDATDLHIAGSAVFFQSGSTVQRVLKNGSNKKAVFTSQNLVHSYVDKTAMLIIDQTADGNANATFRLVTAKTVETKDGEAAAPPAAFPEFVAGPDGTPVVTATAAQNFNAASTRVFASDTTNFYVLYIAADGTNTIASFNKTNLAQTTLVATQKIISAPQIASSAVWWVEDNQRVFKEALATDDQAQGTPTEVFGIGYSQCNLAVNEQAAFCSVGTAIESRDLTGANPKTVLDTAKSKVAAPFGAAMTYESTLFVRSNAPDAEIKHVIRSLKTASGDESFVACGRGLVTGISVDGTDVVWTEENTGVFLATR